MSVDASCQQNNYSPRYSPVDMRSDERATTATTAAKITKDETGYIKKMKLFLTSAPAAAESSKTKPYKNWNCKCLINSLYSVLIGLHIRIRYLMQIGRTRFHTINTRAYIFICLNESYFLLMFVLT